MELSKDQTKVVDRALDWYNTLYAPKIIITGYAGTGKSTIIEPIVQHIRKNSHKPKIFKHRRLDVAYCSYTGKASHVMKTKIKNINGHDYIGTIHGLLYSPKTRLNEQGIRVVIGWKKNKHVEQDLIIVDEASMITKEIYDDLMSLKIPIIFIGDHGQLPPIGDKFKLLSKSDFQLTEIHRQAKENPIIEWSMLARNQGQIPFGNRGNGILKTSWRHPETRNYFNNKMVWDDTAICLCGFNKSRVKLNKMVRDIKGNKMPVPYPPERVICLKNNHTSKVMNGQLGTLTWFLPKGKNLGTATVELDDVKIPYDSCLYLPMFDRESYDEMYTLDNKKIKPKLKRLGYPELDFFDYGYASTVHKFQGSEVDRVFLFEQRNSYQSDDEWRRWLYTAVTRAKKKLWIVTDFY